MQNKNTRAQRGTYKHKLFLTQVAFLEAYLQEPSNLGQYPKRKDKDKRKEVEASALWFERLKRQHKRGELASKQLLFLQRNGPVICWDSYFRQEGSPSGASAMELFVDHKKRQYVLDPNCTTIQYYVWMAFDVSHICPTHCNIAAELGTIERVLGYMKPDVDFSFSKAGPLQPTWKCKKNPVCCSVYFGSSSLYVDDGIRIIDAAGKIVPSSIITSLRNVRTKCEANGETEWQ